MFKQRSNARSGRGFNLLKVPGRTLVALIFAVALAAMAAALFAPPPPPQKPSPKRSISRIRRSLLMRGTARARPSG